MSHTICATVNVYSGEKHISTIWNIYTTAEDLAAMVVCLMSAGCEFIADDTNTKRHCYGRMPRYNDQGYDRAKAEYLAVFKAWE